MSFLQDWKPGEGKGLLWISHIWIQKCVTICILCFSSSVTEIWGPDRSPSPEESFQWKNCHNRSGQSSVWSLRCYPYPPPPHLNASPQISQLLSWGTIRAMHLDLSWSLPLCFYEPPKNCKLTLYYLAPEIVLSIFFFFLTWPWQRWLRATDT